MGDLSFKEVKDKDIKNWDNFLHNAESANIFSHSDFEKLNNKDYKIKRFFIYESKEIIASFKLYLKKNHFSTEIYYIHLLITKIL